MEAAEALLSRDAPAALGESQEDEHNGDADQKAGGRLKIVPLRPKVEHESGRQKEQTDGKQAIEFAASHTCPSICKVAAVPAKSTRTELCPALGLQVDQQLLDAVLLFERGQAILDVVGGDF